MLEPSSVSLSPTIRGLPPAVIAPSLLSSDFSKLADECRRMINLGADWLHMDVMDGHFVPNLTFGAPILRCVRPHVAEGFLDCHLMVADPEKWIEDFAKAGVDQFTFHIEAVESLDAARRICRSVREKKIKTGVAVKPATPVSAVWPLIDEGLIDTLLIMTVEPGFGGQSFMKDMMGKVRQARDRYPKLAIQVDGGLDLETTPIAAQAGANVIVAGTAIFKAKDPQAVIAQMRQGVDGDRSQSK